MEKQQPMHPFPSVASRSSRITPLFTEQGVGNCCVVWCLVAAMLNDSWLHILVHLRPVCYRTASLFSALHSYAHAIAADSVHGPRREEAVVPRSTPQDDVDKWVAL